MRELAEARSFRVHCRSKGSSFPQIGGELLLAALCWKPIRNTGPRSSATAVSIVPASEALLSRSGSETMGPAEVALFLPECFPADSMRLAFPATPCFAGLSCGWFSHHRLSSPVRLGLQHSSRQQKHSVIRSAYLQSGASRRLALASFPSFR